MGTAAAFTPSGKTVTFTASTSAPAPVQVVSTTLGGNQYRVLNAGSVVVFLGFGQTSSDAANNAVVINGGSVTAVAMPLLAGTDEILTFTPNVYVTGITASGNATVYVTPGDGM